MDILALVLKLLLAILCAVAVLLILLSLWGWEKAWTATFGPPDLGPIDFEGLKKRSRPNQGLIAPADLSDESSVDATSPVYDLSAEHLRAELLKIALAEPNIERVDDGSDPLRLRFVQRSPRMRFPDTINVSIIPVDANTSTLAYYARAQIGYRDFDVNLKRGKRWLGRLNEFEAK